MVIEIEGNKTITIQDNTLPDNFEKRDSETSYLNEFKNSFNSDFKYRLIGYRNLRDEVRGQYESNLDVFGGVGITAKLFQNGKTTVNDIDQNCLINLRKNFDNVTQIDVFNDYDQFDTADLVLADFNNFTISKLLSEKSFQKTFLGLLDCTNRFLVINDCSVFHLKYGQKSFDNYSRKLNSKIETYQEFQVASTGFYKRNYGLNVRRIEWFSNSSLILFDKYPCQPVINKIPNNKEEIIKVI